MRRCFGQINFYFFISFTSVVVVISKVVYRTKYAFINRNRTHNSIAIFIVKWFPVLILCLYLIARSIENEIIFVLYLSVTSQQKC